MAHSSSRAAQAGARDARPGLAREPREERGPSPGVESGDLVSEPSGRDLAISTFDLGKTYGRVTALAGLTMSVPYGQVFGFLGPNGAGKTTAVKLLLGLARPTSGHAWVLGAPAGDRETRRRVGYLPELFRYQDWLSAREVLELHCDLLSMRKGRKAAIDDALDTVGLGERGGDRVGGFSKGMQQRLGLAVSLLGQPDLVLLDEPTSALDPVGRHDVRVIIRELKRRDATVFLNSHLLSEVELVCDHVAIVNKGRVVANGPLGDLLGELSTLRIRATGDEAAILALLRAFGTAEPEDGWYTVRGVDAEAVPRIVAALVQAGSSVYAVEPRHLTLEDRFLQLLGETPDAAHHDRATDPA